MNFAHGLAAQLARPHGFGGHLLAGAMDLANRKPTRLAVDLLAAYDGERILDAGCGTGAALAAVRKRANVALAGVDPSREMIAAARARLGTVADLRCATIDEMAFAPASFDAILLLNVLYFSDPEGTMIAGLRQVLRVGGRLIAFVTHRETMERWPFARAGLHRLFNADELSEALVAGGFVRERVCVHEVSITRSVRGLLARATR